ncbi:MAG: hypothetical protein AAB682_03030, partial [Patescibacteria group bacterium]
MPKWAKASLEKTKETESITSEAPKSYEELEAQKAALFAHLEEKMPDFVRHSLPLVLDHSVDDALEFFDRNSEELSGLDLISSFVLHHFVRRHFPFATALQNKVRELCAITGQRGRAGDFANSLLSSIEFLGTSGSDGVVADESVKEEYAKYAIDFPEQENGDLDA